MVLLPVVFFSIPEKDYLQKGQIFIIRSNFNLIIILYKSIA